MIKLKEYTKAISVINEYHKQVEDSIKRNKLLKFTPLNQWMQHNKCSVRLLNVLTAHMTPSTFNNIVYPPTEIHIENVVLRKLIMERNCGKKLIAEFVKLRGY